MVLEDIMKPMADALDEWAVVREKVADKLDPAAAAEARQLATDIRGCLEKIAHGEREAGTKRLQLLRSNALEFLARYK
jgi:hypothetical protein